MATYYGSHFFIKDWGISPMGGIIIKPEIKLIRNPPYSYS